MPVRAARRPRIRRPVPAARPSKPVSSGRSGRIVESAMAIVLATYLPGLIAGAIGVVASVICWIVVLCILFRIFF